MKKQQKIIITGAAGFIGSNACNYFLDRGYEVVGIDNLSRINTDKNLKWIRKHRNSNNFIFYKTDVRDYKKVLSIFRKHQSSAVIHLAAQVAVTSSVMDPRTDFEINALGTFNILEALRATMSKALLIYSSTNKVYGGMEDLVIRETDSRYEYKDFPLGISEEYPLDFHSPYGCSKGAADQYVRDYSRIYGLNTVVFRQSCIYGPRQFGVEDQGWVAWFLIALFSNKKITIYGDGKQVRDLLFVDDLVRAYHLAIKNKQKVRGEIYNVGGGVKNTISIWSDFKPLLEKLFQEKILTKKSSWRPGDQKIYVSNINKIKKDLNWKPKVSVEDGVERLFKWVEENRILFE